MYTYRYLLTLNLITLNNLNNIENNTVLYVNLFIKYFRQG